MNLRRKAISLLLSAAMILNMGVTPVFAIASNGDTPVGASSLCEHHSEHTKECGYTEDITGTPCTHEHTADCYTDEPICGLTEEVLDSASGSNAAHTHTQECYKLDCAHEHDDTCGYFEGTVGTPCTYECLICNPPKEDKPVDSGAIPTTPSNAVIAVSLWQFVDPDKNLTDNTFALPGVSMERQASFDDIIAMLPTTLTGTVEGEADPVTVDIIGWTCESYQQDEGGNWPISGTYTFAAKLTEGYLATPAPTVAVELGGSNVLVAGETGAFTVTGGALGSDYSYENNTLTIKSSTALTISGTTTADKILVQSGVTANITLDGVNIQFNDGNWQNAGTCAFDIQGTAAANITLTGENNLQSGYGKAGLQAPTGATVTIDGTGTLNVTGGLGGAGIGGGENSGAGGAIEITSGTVVARGAGNSAGIGGGWNSAGGTVKINGGTVTAIGGGDGAGVGGGGNSGAGGAVTISGGMVTATGSGAGWGIGSGSGTGTAGTFSTDTSGNALIVANSIHDQGNKTSWSGVIFEGNTGLIYGTPTLTNNAEIPSGKQLTVAEAKTLEIGSGVTLTNRSTIFVYGAINGSGTINNSGGIYTIGTGSVSGVSITGNSVTAVSYVTPNSIVVHEGVYGQDYSYANHTLTILTATQLTISGTTTADKIVVQSGITANITLAGVNIQFNDGEWGNAGTCAFDMTGATVNLTLKNATNNIVRSGNLLPGVKIPAESTLVVDGTGALTAIGGSVGAGIGGDGTEGNLIIKGGKLSAQGTGHNGGFGVMGITTSIVQVQGGELEAIGGINAWTGNANGIGGKLQCNNNSGTAIVITTGITDITNMAEWNGIVFNGTAGFVHGSQTLPRDFEVELGKTLTIGSGATLTVPTGKTLTNAGTITVAQGGKLTNNGTVTNNGTINNNGTIDGTAIGGTAPMEKTATAVTFAIQDTPNTPVTAAEYGQTIVVTATAQKDTTSRTRSAAVGTVDFYLGGTDGTKLGTGNVTNNSGTCTATLEIALTDSKWTPTGPYTITADFGGVAGLQASTGTGSLTINKGSRTIAAPTQSGTATKTTITLNAVKASVGTGDGTIEYGYAATDSSTGITNWQTERTFSGLAAGTTYYFFARITGGTNRVDATSVSGTLIETAPAEQFNLTPGGVYYFDLSGADVKGTVNTAIPDNTLHYVPFTYAGTVKAYSLEASSSGQTGASANATPNIHSLFISDYAVSHTVSWTDLNTANLIFGKSYTSGGVGYTLRAPSAGSATTNNPPQNQGGTPTTNEWDSIYAKNNGYIKNFIDIYSWGQDTSAANVELRALRGYSSTADWYSFNASDVYPSVGWRPVLEVLDASTLTADGLKEVTLNLNGGKLGANTANISIIVKNNTAYTAPSGTGLIAPTQKTFAGWITAENGSGTSYAAGAEVPFTVKTLYAQWALPKETTPAATIDYVNEKLAGLTTGAAYSIAPADGSAQTKTADANGMIDIDSTWFGKTITIVKKGIADTTMDSVAQSLAIPARPAKPTATMEIFKEKNNIVIANGRVSYSGCEFSKDDGATWGASAYFSGLAAATEYTLCVRVKAVANTSFASEAKTVKVTTVAADGSTTLKSNEIIADENDSAQIINSGDKNIGIDRDNQLESIETAITLPSDGGYDVDILPDLKIKVPAGGMVTTKDCPTITLPNGGIVDVYGNVSATAPETVTIGDTTITPPTGGTITTNPGGTSELPGGSTVTTGDGPTITLPDGGTVDKDGNVSATSPETVTVGDSTITPPAGGTITTDKDGKTELPGGSTITNGDTTVTIGDGTSGGSIDKDGNIKLPSGGDITVEDKGGNSSTITVPGTGGDVGVKDDGTVTVPGGSTVTPPGGGIITVPEGGGTVSGDGDIVTNITVATVSVTPTTANVEKGKTQQFTVAVTGTNNPTQTVTWTLEGYTGTASSISASGLLTVGSGETAKTITVKATSTFDTTKSGTAAVTVTSPSCGNTGGGSTGGGNTDNDDSTTVTPSKPTTDNPTPPTIGVVETPVTPDKDGNAKLEVSDSSIKDAIKKAQDQAKKDGTAANGISVTVDVTSKTTANNVRVSISAATIERLIAAKVKDFTIQCGLCTLRFDLETLKQLKAQAGSSAVQIAVGKQDVSKLSKEAQTAIGSRPALTITASYQKDGKTVNITNLGNGMLSVSIPYTKVAAEQSGGLYGVYVDSTGKVTYITGSSYDENSKMLLFGTDHLSIYGVGYKAVPQFTDITNHWAKSDIEFVASRGLLMGTGNDKFSPGSSMTRAMFVTALYRLAGSPSLENENLGYPFADVDASAYYGDAVYWARLHKIVNGVTDETFAPDRAITRQEMAVIIAGYAKAIGFPLPKVHAENTFADNAKIGDFAKDSVKSMQMAGIISGKNGNQFDPTGTATRAEVSAVLRRFVELVLDSGTAQGWMQNDSGKWMYFKDGVKLTGKQTIGGVSYDFNSNGETKTAPDWSFTTYTVVKGDSFWSIAWDYKVNMFTLASVNGKNIFSIIKPGDVLKIPQS